ncbi:YdcF family protein [Hutsoniella sourekii]
MIFYQLSAVLLGMALLAAFLFKPWLQPTTFSLYGLSFLIMGLVVHSNWRLMYALRYFFYIISAFVSLIVPVIIFLFLLLVIFRNVHYYSWRNVDFILRIIIILSALIFLFSSVWAFFYSNESQLANFVNLYNLLALYISSTFVSYIIINTFLNLYPGFKSLDYIVILGAQVGEDDQLPAVLKHRLQAALKIYRRQPNAASIYFIVTGGRQKGRPYSEADLMEAYLREQGVAGQQIIKEDQAQNTYENFIFSKRLMKEAPSAHVLVITSRFHLVRSHYLARMAHFKASFKGSGTPLYLWPYSMVREYMAYILLTKEMNYFAMIFLGLLASTGVII